MDEKTEANPEKGSFEDTLRKAAEETESGETTEDENLENEVDAEGSEEEAPEDGQEEAEEEVEGETEGEAEQELPEEPEDNADRSKLGRRVSLFEKKLDDTSQAIEALAGQVGDFVSAMAKQNAPTEESSEIHPDEALTVGQLVGILDNRDKAKSQSSSNFMDKFSETFFEAGKAAYQSEQITEKQYDNIELDMKDNYKQYSADPKMDAHMNFDKALNRILVKELKGSKVPAKKDNPLKGNKKPVGVSASSTIKDKVVQIPKLDKDTEKLAGALGIKGDELGDMLATK